MCVSAAAGVRVREPGSGVQWAVYRSTVATCWWALHSSYRAPRAALCFCLPRSGASGACTHRAWQLIKAPCGRPEDFVRVRFWWRQASTRRRLTDRPRIMREPPEPGSAALRRHLGRPLRTLRRVPTSPVGRSARCCGWPAGGQLCGQVRLQPLAARCNCDGVTRAIGA